MRGTYSSNTSKETCHSLGEDNKILHKLNKISKLWLNRLVDRVFVKNGPDSDDILYYILRIQFHSDKLQNLQMLPETEFYFYISSYDWPTAQCRVLAKFYF